MINLTDRQRFALRESLCNEISAYSEYLSGKDWCSTAAGQCRVLATMSEGLPFMPTYAALVELLGEWPVGYRGEGGWERIEL